MKNFIVGVIVSCVYSNCLCQANDQSSKEYTQRGVNFFLENFESFDLEPLDEIRKCILKKTVENDLPKQDYKTTILFDRFVIKSFFIWYPILRFNFVQDNLTGKMYFVCLPQLYEMIYDLRINYEESDGIFRLKIPREAISIRATLLTSLTDLVEVSNSQKSNKYEKTRPVSLVVHEMFPELIGNQFEAWEFKSMIGKDRESGMISMDSYSNLIKILQEELTGTEKVVEIFRIEGAGYVMFVYSVNSFDNKTSLEVYLLPENERVFVSNPYLSPYRSCWGKVD